jgi:YjjG family noncanonical pyrimidine nucleotidase
MFAAVFIDADNTLFDFDRTQAKALNESLQAFGLPSASADVAEFDRINLQQWDLYHQGKIQNHEINHRRWSIWLEAVDRADTDVPALSAHYAEALAQQCEKEAGAEALVQFLTARVPVHVITNGFPSSQAHRWRKAGWEDKLHGITVSAEVGVQKPDAKIFELAMKAVGVDKPEHCLMIGDNLVADVEGPQAVGMKGCWYQRNGAENTLGVKPDYTVTHLDQIQGLFHSN